MDAEEVFDIVTRRPRMAAFLPFRQETPLRSPALSRRHLLGAGVALGATALAGSASAAVSTLMCPPQVGQFGGSSGNGEITSGDGGVGSTENIDYSGAVPDDGPGLRHLTMRNAHTGEVFDMDYVSGGQYVQSAIEAFARFARDWRRNEVKTIDPKTIDIVWQVWRKIGVSEPMVFLSGYRSPATNASLPGAAKQSLHMAGKAIDITNPSSSVRAIHAAASSLQAGGVGKYTSSNFVHVDSGRVRYWGS